jgi:transketolase
MVYESIEAAKLLKSKGLSVGVVNMHTIKPLDFEALELVLEKAKLIVTVEEHSVIGGLGGAVAEYKASKFNAPPQLLIGLQDKFDIAGDYRFLLEHHGLVANKIADKVLSFLKENHKFF